MGDRANVLIKSKGRKGVYLYPHWSGSALPAQVAGALKKKERWNDEQYLNRIIFCEMVKSNLSETTGFGITGYVGDGDDRIIRIDVDTQKITMNGEVYSFSDFIELDFDNIDF